MGICQSCCGDSNGNQSGDANERTRLLVDPVSGNSHNINRIHSDEYLSRTPNGNDEQSALSRILHQTASNVIDVQALDNHDLEQHEYYDRMKVYSARMNALTRWNPPPRSGCILVDVPSPDKILAQDALPVDTFNLISEALDKLTEAIGALRVEHKEDLVVPFRIP